MNNSWKLDHVAHAVHDLEATVQHYQTMGGFTCIEREHLPEQGVTIAFLQAGPTTIELIAPLGTNSKVETFLAKRGEGLHHLCFEVEDIDQELRELEAKGARLIDKTPRAGSRHSRIAFVHPSAFQGVLVELCQYPRA